MTDDALASVHYHWNDAKDGLRACSLDDEASAAPTFWVPEPSTEPAPDPDPSIWDGWTELGYTTGEEPGRAWWAPGSWR